MHALVFYLPMLRGACQVCCAIRHADGGDIASFMPKTKRYKRYTKNSSPREGVVNTVSYVKSNVSKLSVPAPVQYQIAPGRQVAYVLAPEDDFIRS